MSEGEGGSAYHVRPATPEDLDWIFQLEIDTYSAQYAVARRTLEQWYCANSAGFSVLTMNGQKRGQITVLPLRPRHMRAFSGGVERPFGDWMIILSTCRLRTNSLSAGVYKLAP